MKLQKSKHRTLLSPTDVVHVEYGREGVKTGGMELVAVLHGDFAKRFEVFVEIGLLYFRQTRCHHLFRTAANTTISALVTMLFVVVM